MELACLNADTIIEQFLLPPREAEGGTIASRECIRFPAEWRIVIHDFHTHN